MKNSSKETKQGNLESFRIQDLPTTARPYEKCLSLGSEALSDAELLAVLLRTGSDKENALALSYRILSEFAEEGLWALRKVSQERLCRIHGIGKIKAVQLLCAIEFGKRLLTSERKERLAFLEPKQIAAYFSPRLKSKKQETVWILLLDNKCRILYEKQISEGTVRSSLISPREIFITALEKEAVNFVLLHNHPSGDPSPSGDDLLVTKRLREGGRLIGIELIDHIIIGEDSYFSMNEKGLL